MTFISYSMNNVPGPLPARETAEAAFGWNAADKLLWGGNEIIDGAARDAGNTGQTTTLRTGLVMGRVTATGKLKQYSPTATDGTQVVRGVLPWPVKVIDPDGADIDQQTTLVIGGPVKPGSLITGLTPYALDLMARSQMRGRFVFDDEYVGNSFFPWRQELAKAADYTVVAADNFTLFTTLGASGAIVFTLPTLARGLMFGFLNLVDQNMTVASAGSADDIVAMHDASADSVAFSTASEKIGGMLRVYANVAGTKWYVENVSAGANTVTKA